jgi:hypothetical protein
MGWFTDLFQRNVEIEYVDEHGLKQTKMVSKRQFDALINKAVAEGKATVHKGCVAHILDPMHGARTENWMVGEQVTTEAYEKFKDRKGNLYFVVVYEKGEPNIMLAQKSMWEQVAQQFSEIDREAAQSFEKFKKDFLQG